MNYKNFGLCDWIDHISGAIEDERELDGNEMRDLVEFLSKMPSWIHVSEGLPKESGEYLVSVIDEYDGNYEAVGVARYDVEEGEWQDLGVDRTVIAWEPKPAPYREGGEG